MRFTTVHRAVAPVLFGLFALFAFLVHAPAAQAADYLLGPEDVAPIARAHVAAADAAVRDATSRFRPAVIFDQDLLSTVVYARHYYGDCPSWIVRLAAERRGDLYLLCHPDLPWSSDGVRDRPQAREEIHALFASALRDTGARVAEVAGRGVGREARAHAAVAELLASRA